MSQPEQSPLFVFHDFENTPATESSEGSGRTLEQWPLHFTITPFFTLDRVQERDALQLIDAVSRDALPIEIVPGDDALYGPNEDIPVTKLKDVTGELAHLHHELVHELGNLGCHFADLGYALDNYSPHVSHKKDAPEPVLVDGAYLMQSVSVGTKRGGASPGKQIIQRTEL